MKVFEEVEFLVPASDVQRKDFIFAIRMAAIAGALLALSIIIL